jgi:hypothetical protein
VRWCTHAVSEKGGELKEAREGGVAKSAHPAGAGNGLNFLQAICRFLRHAYRKYIYHFHF